MREHHLSLALLQWENDACGASTMCLGQQHAKADYKHLCDTEMTKKAQQHPGTMTTTNPAEDSCKKQCGPNKPKQNAIKINPHKRHYNPTYSCSPSRIN